VPELAEAVAHANHVKWFSLRTRDRRKIKYIFYGIGHCTFGAMSKMVEHYNMLNNFVAAQRKGNGRQLAPGERRAWLKGCADGLKERVLQEGRAKIEDAIRARKEDVMLIDWREKVQKVIEYREEEDEEEFGDCDEQERQEKVERKQQSREQGKQRSSIKKEDNAFQAQEGSNVKQEHGLNVDIASLAVEVDVPTTWLESELDELDPHRQNLDEDKANDVLDKIEQALAERRIVRYPAQFIGDAFQVADDVLVENQIVMPRNTYRASVIPEALFEYYRQGKTFGEKMLVPRLELGLEIPDELDDYD